MTKNSSARHFHRLKKTHFEQLFSLANDYHNTALHSREPLRFFIKPLWIHPENRVAAYANFPADEKHSAYLRDRTALRRKSITRHSAGIRQHY